MRKLLGPELFWLLLYGIAALLAKANVPPTKAIENFIEYLCYWIVIPVMLTFALWWLPQVEKNWLLLRVWMACLVGGHFVLLKAMNAHSNQSGGMGMGYLAGMIFIFVFLVAGSVIVTFVPALKKMF